MLTRVSSWAIATVFIGTGSLALLGGCDSQTDPAVGGGGGGGVGGAGTAGSAGCGEEICDGFDNDCDGDVDEDCPCTPGATQRCYDGDPITSGIGTCTSGSQSCGADGVWEQCVGSTGPIDEQCGDSYDNDCDGLIDEDCPCTPGEEQGCYRGNPLTMGIGACRAGTFVCGADGFWGQECVGSIEPTEERCNGVDDDCDGAVDEDGSGGLLCSCPTGLEGAELVLVGHPDGVICIDATEVTRGDYQAWLATGPSATGQPSECAWNADYLPLLPQWPPSPSENALPVVGVNWCDAYAHCQGIGKRLCGAMDGGSAQPDDFDDPWVDEWHAVCTSGGSNAFPYGSLYDPDACNGQDAGHVEALPVGSQDGCRGSISVFDLSGNVWEWENSCDVSLGASDLCKTRGGGWNSVASELECAADNSSQRDLQSLVVGFRCCADAVDLR